MTSTTRRPAHRARYDIAARARDAALAAAALAHGTKHTPKHRAPAPLGAQLERDLRAVNFSVAALTSDGAR